MIKFEIIPETSRCNLYYLASILIVEKIISKLKPKTDLNYSFILTDPVEHPYVLKTNNIGVISVFEETIITETNNALKSIYTNNIKHPCDVNEIAGKIKESLKFYLKDKNPISFPLSFESATNLLTPFSIYENMIEHTHIGLTHKLTVLIMAIYISNVDPLVVQDIQALLKKEPSYLFWNDHDLSEDTTHDSSEK